MACVSEDQSVEELETLSAGTKPRVSHHRLPGRERHGKRKGSMIFLERMTAGHHQSDLFKGNTWEGWGRAHMGFA